MKVLLIVTGVFLSLLNILSAETNDANVSVSDELLHQIRFEKKLYSKLSIYLKNGSKNQNVEDILTDYDTALMGLFELVVKLNKQFQHKHWDELRAIYLLHMREINGPDAIEGWHEIGEFLKKKTQSSKSEISR